ncbi:MAG: hypothetical protein ABUK01_08715 [Leptospirales bacterium]
MSLEIDVNTAAEAAANAAKHWKTALIAVAAAMAVAIPALATAWAQSKIGSAGLGALAERPDLRGVVIILVAIPETMVIIGFAVAYLIIDKM